MMSQNKDFLKDITKLLEQASVVGRMCSDEAVKRSMDDDLAIEIHSQYMIWKCEVDLFLQDYGFRVDLKFFRIENTVPMMKYGLEYGDKDSKQSRDLIKAISLELEEKLKHLRELFYREGDKATNEDKIAICCSIKDGIYICGSKPRPYPISKQRLEIVKLIHTKGSARLKEITRKLGISNDQNTSRNIKIINEEFKEKLKIEHDFICRNTAVGFYLNDARYSISIH